jgi:collagen triple helix repeat protein
MTDRPRNPVDPERKRSWPAPSIVTAGAALFIALGGSAVAANSLIHAGNIAPGAVTSRAIRNAGVEPRDLSTRTRALLQTGGGLPGAKGETGSAGVPGTNGPNGANGASGPNGVDGTNGTDGANGVNGIDGRNGVDGADGTNGVTGTSGTNGTNGLNGAIGANGADGTDGVNGTNGVDGTDGTVTPLSAKQGLTALPTASPPTTVVELAVPAGNYVVLAKTQLSQTGAGDSIECTLKAGGTTIDQVAMKTLPALAAIPVPLQAVATTASPSQLSVECKVQVANGAANFSSLIAIPTA